jgi:hypothetical protein
MSPLSLDFYGVRVSVECDSEEVRSAVARDFSFFRVDRLREAPLISISCHATKPPFDSLTQGRQVMVQPGFVAYRCGDSRVVDYHGKAVSRFDFRTESGDLWSEDLDLLWEKLYLLIHSRVGELLDKRGFHRVHALGLSISEKGVICLLPSGGGKTTLGLAALGLEGVRLLSDDTPLITRSGKILPFPLRIGLGEKPAGIDERFIRRFKRREHGDKWLIDIEAFDERIEKNEVGPNAILIGKRLLGKEASIARLPRHRAAPELFRSAVVGLGLPQLVEYFLRAEIADAPNKARIAASRTAACSALLARSKVYRFDLSRDHEANKIALKAFLEGPFRG